MHSEKKMTSLHDTWKSDDLKKHIQGGGYDEDPPKRRDRVRRDEDARKYRSGESVERQHKQRESTQERRLRGDSEKDRVRSTRERRSHDDREKDSERDGIRERTSHRDQDKEREGAGTRERRLHGDRAKERDRVGKERDGSRDTRSHSYQERDSERDRRKDSTRDRVGDGDERERERKKEKERDRMADGRKMDFDKEGRDRRHERIENDIRERERRKAERNGERGTDRHRRRVEGMEERERDRETERARERRGEREKERDRERHRERGGDREGRKDKDRYTEKGQGYSTKHLKEDNDVEETQVEWRRGKETRHSEREHRRHKEDQEYREQRRREKEERDKRRKAREEREGGDREAEHERRRRERKEAERNSRGTEDRERRHREDECLDSMTVTEKRRSLSPKALEEPWTLEEKENSEVGKVSSEDQGQDRAEEEYEDDFEDYEEDFEDIEDEDEAGNSGGIVTEDVEAIRRAMEAENERVGSALCSPQAVELEAPKEGDAPGARTSRHRSARKGKFIDFVAAKHREVSKKVAIKQKKRSSDLLRLIDLDFSITFSLLDLPPLSEYDMYIKSFGTTNTKQAYVQCNEDNADREIQTEEVEMCDRWTQHPADRGIVCGGPNLTLENPELADVKINSQRLAAFLLSASQVVSVLLEEDRAERLSLGKAKAQADGLSFSDGGLHLNPSVPFLHGREVALIVFSQVQRQTMLSVHRPLATSSTVRLDSNTILCVWNIWEPSQPQKILVYESEVLCCCFSPSRASLVFAGTAVGSLVLWDLREHYSLHCNIRVGDHDWILRYPTFSTDSVLGSSGHLSAVMSVEPILTAVIGARRSGLSFLSSKEESSRLSFQLASLDERGVLNLWVVVELPQADQAGSQNDLGLKPGGKVKLLLSSTIITLERLSPGHSADMDPVHSLMLKFLPSDSNHFFIGTSKGLVAHGTRHGPRRPPRFYKPRAAGPSPAHVTCLDFSPFGEPMFLVGCDDSTVRLHSVATELPILEWSCCGPVLSAQWSLTRPAVFCVLDSAPTLHLWDLFQKDSEPVVTEPLHADGVITMAVFGDPSKQNSFSGISLARCSGKIEIQRFNSKWTLSPPDELEKIESLLYGAH